MITTEQRLKEAETLIASIKDALGTAEDGENLVDVARDAHRAEVIMASLKLLMLRESN